MSPTGRGPLRIAIEDFLQSFNLGEVLWKSQKTILESFEDEALSYYEELYNQFEHKEVIPDMFKPGNIRNSQQRRPVQIVPILLGIAMMMLGLIIGAFTPIQKIGMYAVDKNALSFRPSITDGIQMFLRGGLKRGDVDELATHLGINPTYLEGYRKLSRQLLLPREYYALYLRGKITLQQFQDQMFQFGFDFTDIDKIKELGTLIPPVSDLISMGVKEAFNDEVATKYGYDQDFPADFGVWAEKQGLPLEWSKRYWRQHWQLPSVTQVYEMLHRLRPGKSQNPVTTDDMLEFLKVADISPSWRQRLIDISYSPYTRVDIRRMYKFGVLDEAGVKNAYLDLGYDEEKANKLTDFTIKLEGEEETGIAKSSVSSAYSDGMIDRRTAEEMLKQSKYDDITIKFLLDGIDFNHAMEVNKILLSNIHQKYVEGILDDVSVYGEIGKLNLPSERVKALIELWTTEKTSKLAILTVSQAETLFERGIIDETQFRTIYKKRGYDDTTTNWQLTRIAQEASDKASAEAERTQKEAERIAKNSKSTQYQKDKANLDFEIATLKDTATNIQVALLGDVTEEETDQMNEALKQIKLDISSKNVEKAQLVVDLRSSQ